MSSPTPRPILALILVFPTVGNPRKRKSGTGVYKCGYNCSGKARDCIWFKQMTNSACGLYGILHAVCNGDARKVINKLRNTRGGRLPLTRLPAPNSTIAKLLTSCIPLAPAGRTKAFESSEEIESAYLTRTARECQRWS